MQKEKIVKITPHRNDQDISKVNPFPASMSEELESAIKNLIHRLRELGPMIPPKSE